LVGDIPAGDGKNANLFYSVTEPIVWTLTTGADIGKYLEHAGTRRKGEGRDEEGDEEGVDKPVLLEKAGQLFVAAHPQYVAPVQVYVQSSTLQINLIGQNYAGCRPKKV
jgi:hypothetical protein